MTTPETDQDLARARRSSPASLVGMRSDDRPGDRVIRLACRRGPATVQVSLPEVADVRELVRNASRDLLLARSGRRTAAVKALWIAATDTEEGPDACDPEHALLVYGMIEHDARVEMRAIVGRAAMTESDPAVQRELVRMSLRFAELECFTVAPPMAPRRRPAR